MQISVVNFSSSLSDQEVREAIRAVNRQISEDFFPHWALSATLRLEGKADNADPEIAKGLRGDAVIYLADQPNVANALGFHDENRAGLPFGFVFTAISDSWTATLSHEALELIADANVNEYAIGPHPDPAEGGRPVLHWYEMCDAVQAETYDIDGIEVSNFVLPLYFTLDEQIGAYNDFLNDRDKSGDTLKSFGIKSGGYVGFIDLQESFRQRKLVTDTYHGNDPVAIQSLERKKKAGITRRTCLRTALSENPDLFKMDTRLKAAEELFEAREKVNEAAEETARAAANSEYNKVQEKYQLAAGSS